MIKFDLATMNDVDTLVKLLNKVTLHLHKKGINQWDYPWEIKHIEMDIRNGYTYILRIDDLIVGTFSLKAINKSNINIVEENSKYLYRIAILPEYQGKNVGKEIINYVWNHLKKFDESIYLDCWSGNKKLREFYSSEGFEFIGDFKEEDYMISVFKYK